MTRYKNFFVQGIAIFVLLFILLFQAENVNACCQSGYRCTGYCFGGSNNYCVNGGCVRNAPKPTATPACNPRWEDQGCGINGCASNRMSQKDTKCSKPKKCVTSPKCPPSPTPTFTPTPIATAAPILPTGTPTTVLGNGPWNWTCSGSGGGSNASCSATKLSDDSQNDPTNPACNLCLNPAQGDINEDSNACNNSLPPGIKLINENSIGDKVTGIDASQNLKLDWTNSLPENNLQCFATYNFKITKSDTGEAVMSQNNLDLSEITIPVGNLLYGTNYKWNVTATANQLNNNNVSLTNSDITAIDCDKTAPFSITKTIDIPINSRINSGTLNIPSSNDIKSISINGTTYDAPITNQDILKSLIKGTNIIIIDIDAPAKCGS